MKIGVIIQARMSSQRCPGKILRPLGETCVLGQLIKSLQFGLFDPAGESSSSTPARVHDPNRAQSSESAGRYDLAKLIVATSTTPSDDEVATFCEGEKVDCFRGSLPNVAERVLQAAQTHQLDAFVRLSGDSPLFDYRLAQAAISRFVQSDFDLTSNVVERTFPKGQSVEVIRRTSLETAIERFSDESHFEHVTPYFYANASSYSIDGFGHRTNESHIQLSVDTELDYEIVNTICGSLSQPVHTYSWQTFAQLGQDFRAQSMGVAV